MDPSTDFELTSIKIQLEIDDVIVVDSHDMLMVFVRIITTQNSIFCWLTSSTGQPWYDSILRSPFLRPASSDFDLCLELATDPREEGRSGFNLSIPSSPLIWLKYIYFCIFPNQVKTIRKYLIRKNCR